MKKTSIKLNKEWLTGYLMIFPVVAGLLVFYIYPIFKVIIDSFYEVGSFNKRSFVGLDNYLTMFNDPKMWSSLFNTFSYVIVIVPGTIIISLILAALLNTKIKGRGFFRVVYFIPAITMGAAVAMIWKWMYNSDHGIINAILNALGFDSVNFLTNPNTALLSICLVSIWINVGYNMIILLAGIQGISKTYYEAASIDGASPVKQFFGITLPLVTPTLFFVLITNLIGTFQTFDTIYMMIKESGIAMEATQSMVMYFFRNAFSYSKKGYASALAVFLFLIIMLVTLIQMKLQKKWVNYE
ncbi:carbohydrate ABC transporter permease [Catonella massiliensis]|jgi:ABC transporter, permease protein|uniref:Sugar ABC transporter permease n=1 Tax=Catonella massiliensis TaxID=2799636 RepID=A0ABS1IZH2_9FIRM|nr:sugar ABC transporter permease [Catonella massiliensis]MBK5897282.1 sugar ABC transporter permease [Catonella massiliensis]